MLRRQFMFKALAAVPAVTAARSAFGDASGLPASSGPIALEARNDRTTAAGKAAYLSLYNSLIPGLAIEARAGDTLRIDFRNSLSAGTNLHFHGLHVSPAGIADNSFLEVPSNESMRYEAPIPWRRC
jgi:FtsP/CotA-like multicopper oxidase with cupredoxin domain